jgi:hypothetical protein
MAFNVALDLLIRDGGGVPSSCPQRPEWHPDQLCIHS